LAGHLPGPPLRAFQRPRTRFPRARTGATPCGAVRRPRSIAPGGRSSPAG